MTLQIGNKKMALFLRGCRKKRGFSFVELMVTVAVLSSGIILIYKAFFISLSYLNHVTNRLYAIHIMDNVIVNMQLDAAQDRAIIFRQNEQAVTVKLDNRQVDFHYFVRVYNVENLAHIFRVETSCFWKEGSRDSRISRTGLITDYRL